MFASVTFSSIISYSLSACLLRIEGGNRMPKFVTTSAKETVWKEIGVGGGKALCKFRTVITFVVNPCIHATRVNCENGDRKPLKKL